jgi:hypothetical protein
LSLNNIRVRQSESMPWNAPPEQPVASQPIPVERLLTTRQVAAILNVSIETVRKWRRRGIGPMFLKLDSGAVRYRLEEVQKYLSDCALTK